MKIPKYKNLTRKQKNILWIIVILLAICLSVTVIHFKKSYSTIEQNFHIENTDAVNKIVITDKITQDTLLLDKQSDTLWTVNKKYEANKVLMRTVLQTLQDMRIRELLPKAARNNVVKDLAVSSTVVDVYAQDYKFKFWFVKLGKAQKLIRTYYVGNSTQDEMGTYMLRKGDKQPYVIYIPNFRGYLSSRFSAREDLWRSHNIFKFKQSEIESLSVELPADKRESFTLVNNGKGFSFLNAEGKAVNEFDTTKVVALLSSFVEMNYENIAKNIPKVERDTIFTKSPSFIVTIKDNKGKTSTLKTYVKLTDPTSIAETEGDFYEIFDINRCYAIASTLPDTLIMQFFTLDNVLKPASYFMRSSDQLPYQK